MKPWGIILFVAYFVFIGSKAIIESMINKDYFRCSIAVVGLVLLVFALSQKLKKSDQPSNGSF